MVLMVILIHIITCFKFGIKIGNINVIINVVIFVIIIVIIIHIIMGIIIGFKIGIIIVVFGNCWYCNCY